MNETQPQPQKMNQIAQENEMLTNQINELEKATALLEERLKPVMRNESKHIGNIGEKELELVQFAMTLKEHRQTVNRIINKVKDITDRLEL